MANENFRNDPDRTGLRPDDARRPSLTPDDPHRPGLADPYDPEARLEREAQIDPELAEGRAGTGKIALLALLIALVLGAVFYGLNNSNVQHASTTPPAQTAQTPPANPNNQSGVTTGSATSRPTPPQAGPKGTEVDQSANPASGNNHPNK
jgi:uncharacterized protein HemX